MSARKVAFRSGTLFAHTCAFAESVKAAMLYCCHLAAERKHAVSRRRTRGLSLKITKIFRVSSRKICEHLLFEYRALYVVHVFGDAVVHAHQLHDFVARIDDGGVIAPAHDLADGDEGKRKHIAH